MIVERARSEPLLRWGWVPLLLTTLLRAAWLERFPVDALGPVDAGGYHLLARSLLDGHGFAIAWEPPFCPTAIRTPLYPLFVAAIYGFVGWVPQVVVVCQILLETLTTALVMVLAARLSQPRRPGHRFWPLLPGMFYALNGTTQRFTGYLLSEALLLPLLAAALCLTVLLLRKPRPGRAAGAGLAWGLVVLTKPNAEVLLLAVIALVFVSLLSLPRKTYSIAHRLVVGAVFCGVMGASVAPWIIRNHRQFDRWLLSTAFEENLARVSAVVVRAHLAGVEAEPWTPTWEHLYAEFAAEVDPDAAVVLAPASCAAVDRHHEHVAAAARNLVIDHVGLYTGLHVRGVVRSLLDPSHRIWYRVLTGRDWAETGVLAVMGPRIRWALERGAWGDALAAFWQERVARVPLGAGLLWWGLCAGRAAVGWFAGRGVMRLRREWAIALLLAGTIAYHLILPGPIAHDRFYAPVVPVVAALVACGAGGYNRIHSLPACSRGSWGGHDD